MTRVLLLPAITCAVGDIAGTFFKGNSEDTKHNLQPFLKIFAKSSHNKMEDVWANLTVVMKSNIKEIV